MNETKYCGCCGEIEEGKFSPRMTRTCRACKVKQMARWRKKHREMYLKHNLAATHRFRARQREAAGGLAKENQSGIGSAG